ncbi:phosphatase PAP2 family protein [Lachnoclostridium sp. Marseille-P6806]|uniref:phosphatase PAP2 family protein n=1 Tax=Lachnoclostridium sp. Marseille-P6806 TaxID=2364793 RepID=UPI0013EF281F|nr:phosphatase PAP2 family protein [Lachnoclostridium sp. Marseille-P6806]
MVIFFSVYLAWFFIIEHMNRLHYTVIHTALDDYIPFVEVFVIPYYLWFFYVTGAVIVLYFTDREMYHRTASLLCIGMTAFLLVSTLWSNIQYMRPSEFARDNLFTRMVGNIYRVDTPSNLCPSIHVYNSIGVAFGILGSRSKKLRSHAVRAGSVVLSAAISLSTMFIKQHSVFDVLCACAMAAGAYVLCFRWGFTFAGRYNMQGTLVRRRRRRQRQLIH